MVRFPAEIDGKKVLKALARFGWIVVSQDGSHRKLRRGGAPPSLIVAFHRTLSRHSLRETLRLAGIAEEDFQREL